MDTCIGPAKNGETCGREVSRRDLCAAHYRQWLCRGRAYEMLECLKGPQGQKYEDPQRLHLGVDKSEYEALEALGAKLPEHPTDKRQKSESLRGLRHLIAAFSAGGVLFVGEWRIGKKYEYHVKRRRHE